MGLSRQVAIIAGGRAASTASVFLVNALLARTWSVPDFGRFSAVWILGNTLAPVFLLGIPSALLYALPRRDNGAARRGLVTQASVVLALSAAVLAVGLWFAADHVAPLVLGRGGAAEAARLAIYFLPYVVALVAAGHVEATLVAAGRPTWPAALALLAAAASVGVAAWVRAAGWDVARALMGLSAVGLGRLLVGHGLLLAALGRPRLGSPAGLGSFLAYAAHIGLNDAVGSLSRAVDRAVVLALLGAADLALYHVGAVEVPVSLALAAVVTVLVPQVSRLSAAGRLDEVGRLFAATAGRLALVILPLFAFLFVHAGTVIDLYLPGAYDRTDEVFRIFLLALPLRCAVYNPILVGTGRAPWALYAAIGDLVANATLSVLLVLVLRGTWPAWALLGPAAATVAATWAQVTVLVSLLTRLLGRPWTRLLPWARLGRVGAVSAAAAALSWWVAEGLSASPGGHLLLAAAVFAPLIGGGLAAWRRQDWDELTGVLRAVGRKG